MPDHPDHSTPPLPPPAETPLLADGDDAAPAPASKSPRAPRRKAPAARQPAGAATATRRRVARRPVASAALAADEGPVAGSADGDAAPDAKPAPRAADGGHAADSENAAADNENVGAGRDDAYRPISADAERQQPSASEGADPQTRVETRVLSRDVMAVLEEKTAAIFGTPPREQTPMPAPGAPAATASADSLPSATDFPVSDSAAFPPSTAPSGPQQQPTNSPPASGFRRPQHEPGHGGHPHRGGYRDSQQQPGGGRPSRPPYGAEGGGGNSRPAPQQQGGYAPRPVSPYPPEGGSGAQGGGGFANRPAEPQFAEGLVEVSGKGFGFLREAKRNYVQTPNDTFVTPEVCRRYNLRDGVFIKGEIRRSSRGPQLFRLTEIYGEDPEGFRNLPNFDDLTTINPRQRIKLETVPERYTTRVMDLMTPIGKGQRGLIVAPPRTGKTTLLQHIGEAVVKNHPAMKLIILLVDERPEEVTEIRRAVPEADIMASSNDSDLKSHVRIATLAMDRAKRLVEAGKDVFILLDSITRVARAFNNATAGGGRTGSGGLDVRAMEIPRKIFAAARNTEEAGSLTIMATALIETGSKMDEVIFQEFKGTGNMELVLDRKISDMRVYPAVDIFLSGTRREELLLQEWELHKINVIRRGLAGHKPIEAIERLLSILKKFPTNAQMLTSLPG